MRFETSPRFTRPAAAGDPFCVWAVRLWLPTPSYRTLSELILRQVRILLEIGDAMRLLCCLLMLCSGLLSGCGEPQKKDAISKNHKDAAAIAAINEFGGRVELARSDPFSPVDTVLLRFTEVTDSGLEHLKELKSLRVLNLNGTKVTGSGFVHLKKMKRLQYLLLGSLTVTDVGMEHLKELKSLRCLNLNATLVTDAGLRHLKGLKKMEDLYLSSTKVTDSGLEYLKDMTRLKSLKLNHKVTDAGLVHLKGLTNLKSLDLSSTKVTDAGVKRLQAALPKCKIRK